MSPGDDRAVTACQQLFADFAQTTDAPLYADLAAGIADDPDNQAQPEIAFRPDKEGNIAIYGTSGSGKSVFLRSMAVAARLAMPSCGTTTPLGRPVEPEV